MESQAISALTKASDLITEIFQDPDRKVSDLTKQEKRLLKASCENALDHCLESKNNSINISNDAEAKQEVCDIWFAPIQQLQQILAQL